MCVYAALLQAQTPFVPQIVEKGTLQAVKVAVKMMLTCAGRKKAEGEMLEV